MRYLVTVLASLCAAVPVLALLLLVASTFVQAMPALTTLGWSLLGPEANNGFSMRAPLWGTFLAATLALGAGVPVALSIALVKREFQVPIVSRALSSVVGTLAGIPPVIYAVSVLFVVPLFMAPKFAGSGLPDQRVQAAIVGVPYTGFGGLPDRIPNTAFLGGMLLALLIIPFMVPLIDDALRAVPTEFKVGSYALGATRWYTLRHIILPHAVPGVVSAATLGALLAIGEAIIPYFVLGGAENIAFLPDPLWNLFRRVPALTSWGATQMGGLGSEAESTLQLAVSVAYAAGLMLIVLAFAIMGAEFLVLRRVGRRLR